MGTHQAPDTGELWWQSLRSYHPSSCLDLESTAKHHLPKPPMPSYKDILLVYFPPCRVTDEGGNDNPFQYSCLENPMDRRAWQATVHRVTKSWMWLTDCSPKNKEILMCHNVYEPWEHCAKWNMAVIHTQKNTVWFYLYGRAVKFIDTESRRVVARGCGQRMSYDQWVVSVFQDEKSSLEMDASDSCTKM